MLNDIQRARLRAAGQEIARLRQYASEAVIELAMHRLLDLIFEIRGQSPESFHTEETLKTRVFIDQPCHEIPMRGFVLRSRIAA